MKKEEKCLNNNFHFSTLHFKDLNLLQYQDTGSFNPSSCIVWNPFPTNSHNLEMDIGPNHINLDDYMHFNVYNKKSCPCLENHVISQSSWVFKFVNFLYF